MWPLILKHDFFNNVFADTWYRNDQIQELLNDHKSKSHSLIISSCSLSSIPAFHNFFLVCS